jgi:hypothetical protein
VRANHRAGLATYLMKIAQVRPDLLTMGNVDGQPTLALGSLRDAEYEKLVPIALAESSMGVGHAGESWSGWDNVMGSYRSLIDRTMSPQLVVNTGRGNGNGTPLEQPSLGQAFPAGYAFMRYCVASTLLEDGYIAWSDANGYDITNYDWFDEFDQFLGQAIDGPVRSPTWTSGAAAGAYMRRFQNGAAIVNPRLNPSAQGYSNRSTVTIDLTGQGYKRFSGSQDSTTNNGAVVTTFNLAPGDGIILVRQ